jgi:hypothetical protein
MNELDVLKAIEAVRLELAQAIRNGDFKGQIDAGDRLLALYASMNVHNVIVLIQNSRKAA